MSYHSLTLEGSHSAKCVALVGMWNDWHSRIGGWHDGMVEWWNSRQGQGMTKHLRMITGGGIGIE